MILIILFLIISLFLFLNFDKQRKRRNVRYRNAKKEQFEDLLRILRKEDEEDKNTTQV